MASRQSNRESLSSGDGTVVLTHDSEAGHGVTASIVSAVADLRGVDSTEVTPQLGAVIETDAIESLFPSPQEPGRSLVFEFADCEVVVRGDGRIAVTETDQTVAS